MDEGRTIEQVLRDAEEGLRLHQEITERSARLERHLESIGRQPEASSSEAAAAALREHQAIKELQQTLEATLRRVEEAGSKLVGK